jgi:hypothetical protein
MKVVLASSQHGILFFYLVISLLCSNSYSADETSLSDLKPIAAIELKAETNHVQGIAVDGDLLWVTSVNKKNKSGHLYRFNLQTGELINQIEVQDGEMYHPGGISLDGENLWIPVAAYRREGPSLIERRNKTTLKVVDRFSVDDHIGCVAVNGEQIIGGNWDSLNFYFWDKKGAFIKKIENPNSTGYQDMKCVDGFLVASGVLKEQGAIDWIDLSTMKLLKRIVGGKTDRGVCFMNEGMAIYRSKLYLLPEDNPSRLFVFQLEK